MTLLPNENLAAPYRPNVEPAAIAGLLVAVVVMAVMVVVQTRGSDGTVAGPERDTPTLTAPAADASRRAAQWVLDRGGAVFVRVGPAERWVRRPTTPADPRWATAAPDLPADPFLLTVINLAGSGLSVTDADLDHLAGLTAVVHLDLSGTGVTDAGMARVGDLANLTVLSLEGTAVTDAGAARLRRLTDLQVLNLGRTRVTDEGLVHLR